jgi:uncharacterized metal-binding protein
MGVDFNIVAGSLSFLLYGLVVSDTAHVLVDVVSSLVGKYIRG